MIVANDRFEKSEEIARRVSALLDGEHDVDTETLTRERLTAGNDAPKERADVVVTIGGDGTILSALQQYEARILGINIGEVGFLTEISPDQIDEAFRRVVEGDYNVESQIRVKTTVNGERLPDALNELVLHATQIAKLQQFRVYLDKEPIMNVRADGIIVATPTGSTCYSMSAGGPILDPRVRAFVVLPIAPYKLSARPYVVPSESRISMEMVREKDCTLVLDGQYEVHVSQGDTIEATVSDKPAEFIRFDTGFYSKLQKKLSSTLL